MGQEAELIQRLHNEMPDKVATALLWELRRGRFEEAPSAYLILLRAEVHLCNPDRIKALSARYPHTWLKFGRLCPAPGAVLLVKKPSP
jgi:hypothetical protein